MNKYVEIDEEIRIYGKIDKQLLSKFSYRIDEKLMKKYNSIKNFMNEDTVFEDGCLNEGIDEINYIIDKSYHNFIMVKTSTYNRFVRISKSSGIKIDRKYNCLELRLG